MNKDKKIELQNQIIQKLQSENDYLKKELSDLENKKSLFERCEQYAGELQASKEKYDALIAQLLDEKKQYKKEFESFMKTVKKNM